MSDTPFVRLCFSCDEPVQKNIPGNSRAFCSPGHFNSYKRDNPTAKRCHLFNASGFLKEESAVEPPFYFDRSEAKVHCIMCDSWHPCGEDTQAFYNEMTYEDILSIIVPEYKLSKCPNSHAKSFPNEVSAKFWKSVNHRYELYNEVYECACGMWHVGVVEISDCPITRRPKFDTAAKAATWSKSLRGEPAIGEYCECGSYHPVELIKTCGTPDKVIHNSYIEAEQHRLRVEYSEELHSYLCRCDKWHVGRYAFSKKRQDRMVGIRSDRRRRGKRASSKKTTMRIQEPVVKSSSGPKLSNSMADFLTPEQLKLLQGLSQAS